MSKSAYNPQPGSVAYQVIEFLTTNPTEELTPDDVSVKCDRPVKQVHSLLGDAVLAGVLKRGENADGDIAYTLGTGVPGIKPSKARNPSLRPDALLAGAAVDKRALPPPEPVDIAAIEIRGDIPVPQYGRGQVPVDWSALLARTAVGDSFPLDLRRRSSIGKVIKLWRDEKRGDFLVRRISDSEIRVWRVK